MLKSESPATYVPTIEKRAMPVAFILDMNSELSSTTFVVGRSMTCRQISLGAKASCIIRGRGSEKPAGGGRGDNDAPDGPLLQRPSADQGEVLARDVSIPVDVELPS